MDISQIVSNALPFLMAYVIQFLKSGIPQLTENTLRILLAEGEHIEGWPRDIAIKLAVHMYRQLSFILSVLLSTVSALVLTLTSDKRFVGGIVAFVLLVIIVVWVFRWQTLGSNEKQRQSRDREMFWVSLLTTTLMLFATLYSRGLFD